VHEYPHRSDEKPASIAGSFNNFLKMRPELVRFEDLRIFVAATDLGSFSAAARELDLTPAVASAALKRLEQELETRLFVRSTRSLRLTSDGERYLEYARSAISTLEAGKNAMARDKTDIAGTLSVSIPSDLGRHVLLPWLDEFQRQHDGTSLTIPVKGDRVGDDGDLVRRWALAGHGVAYKSRYDVLTDLRAGRLVELLTGYVSEPSPLYLLCVHRMLLSPAVRRLREFLQERFKAFEAG